MTLAYYLCSGLPVITSISGFFIGGHITTRNMKGSFTKELIKGETNASRVILGGATGFVMDFGIGAARFIPGAFVGTIGGLIFGSMCKQFLRKKYDYLRLVYK